MDAAEKAKEETQRAINEKEYYERKKKCDEEAIKNFKKYVLKASFYEGTIYLLLSPLFFFTSIFVFSNNIFKKICQIKFLF